MMRRDEPASLMHLLRPLILLAVLALLMLWAEYASGDSVRIHDVSGSNGPTVTLAQVAELRGDYANRFADVVVGSFGEEESTVEVEASAILQAIRDSGAKLGLLDFQGFSKCMVHRTFTGVAEVESEEGGQAVANIEAGATGQPLTVYTPTTVRGLIEQSITEGLGLTADRLEMTFNDRDGELLGSSAVAGRYQVEPVVTPRLGTVSFKVYAYQGTRRIDEGRTVGVRVRQRVLAVIAAEPIARNTLINRSQVRLREVLIDDGQAGYVASTDLVVGQVASRAINPGDLVTAGEIRLPVAVRRRERVSVELQARGVQITFTGVAQDEGTVGDRVEVQNPQTGERFTAEVVGRGQVVVRLNGRNSQEKQGDRE